MVSKMMIFGMRKQSGKGPSSLHMLSSTCRLILSVNPRGSLACNEKYLQSTKTFLNALQSGV